MYDSRGFKLNTPTYSTAGNLTDRGYPDSKSGIGAAGATGSKIDTSTRVITPSNTGSGSGSSSSSAVSGNASLGDYLSSLYAQRQAAAQDAYDRAIGLLDAAYNKAASNYGNIYNSGVGQLNKSYDNSLNKINDNAKQSMQEAYINKMLSMKNLSQALAAQGMSGGASESATAGLINNYGNARNGIQKTWDTNRADLEMNYSNNLADLYNAYQSQMAALNQSLSSQQAQLLSNLNNQIADIGGDYFSALSSNPALLQNAMTQAVSNLNAYKPVETQATNTFNPVNTQQVNDVGSQATRWWEDQIMKQLAGGSNLEGAVASLAGRKGEIPQDELLRFINKLAG